MSYTDAQLDQIDRLVAEKVMGWTWINTWEYSLLHPQGHDVAYWYEGTNQRDGKRMVRVEEWRPTRDRGQAMMVIEKLTEQGSCVALVNDDNGHWAMPRDGFQTLPMGEETQDISTTFFIEKRLWHDDWKLAICLSSLEGTGVEGEA